MTPEEEVLNLIDKASTQGFARDISQLERLVDVGDRIIAQQAVFIGAKAEAAADPTNAESP